MGRPAGRKNADHAEKRAELCRSLVPHLLTDGRPTSLRELARQAGVSVPTLRHYFGDRDGVVAAVMERSHVDFQPMLRGFSVSDQPVRQSLKHYLQLLLMGWKMGDLSKLITGSLVVGLEGRHTGHAAVDHVLEPTLQTLEKRLATHVERGELRADLDVRAGALMILSPLLLGLWHQEGLDGVQCRPLDLEALIERVVDGFLDGHGTA